MKKIGIWRETGSHPSRDFTRVRIPGIIRGAINHHCRSGHMYVLGVRYTWHYLNQEWAITRGLSLFGIVSFLYEDTEGGTLKSCHPGLRINWIKLDIRAAIRPARPY